MNEFKDERNREAFQKRWNFYIQTFIDSGFTEEQAEKLVREFSELKTI